MTRVEPIPRYGDEEFLDAWSTAWSCGDPDRLLPLMAPDALYRDDGSDLDFHGHDEIARFYRFMLRFAPDSAIRFTAAHGDADGFAARWTWSGTASGRLRLGDRVHETTGATFSVEGVAWCGLTDDGLLASHVDYYDMRAVVQAVVVDPGA
jgi:steroid delta-isomerase-like uncharacterized protein